MKLLFYIGLSFLLIACNGLEHKLRDFTGQRIDIPPDLQALVHGRDTTLTDFAESDLKIVAFFDSIGCSSCTINRLHEWNEIIAYTRQLPKNVRLYFIFAPRKTKHSRHEIRNSLKASNMDYPVFIDTLSSFLSANPAIPGDKRFHTFLLDENNKVVLVGNPQGNEKLWQLYKGEIQNRIADKTPSSAKK